MMQFIFLIKKNLLKNYKALKIIIETIFGSNVINRDVYEKIEKLNGRKVVYKKRSGWFATIAPTTTSINII